MVIPPCLRFCAERETAGREIITFVQNILLLLFFEKGSQHLQGEVDLEGCMEYHEFVVI